MMKPFMKYPGGKTKELPLIKKSLPNNIDRYFEPFVGGGSVYFDLGIKDSYINDFSFDLINFYKLIKEQNDRLKNMLMFLNNLWIKIDSSDLTKDDFDSYDFIKYENYKNHFYKMSARKNGSIEKLEQKTGKKLTKENIEELNITAKKSALYMTVRDSYNEKNKDLAVRAAVFFFMREYCYSSMFRFSSRGDFNVPYGGMSYNSKTMSGKIDRMFSNDTYSYFKNTTICNLDFEAFLNQYKFSDKDFIFLDPPYDSDFSTYDQHNFDKKEQIRLRDCLKNIKAKWMLVIKNTDFIWDLYKNFNIYEYDMNYMVSFKNRNDRDVKHLLITNYPIKEE